MDYYFEIKKPNDFRYNVMLCMKECLRVQELKEKLELVYQTKKDLFAEVNNQVKELEDLNTKIEALLVDDELKKEIQQEVEKEKKQKVKQEKIAEEKIKKEHEETEEPTEELPVFEDLKKIRKKSLSPTKKSESENEEPEKSFDYTLEQIEKKLSELRKD